MHLEPPMSKQPWVLLLFTLLPRLLHLLLDLSSSIVTQAEFLLGGLPGSASSTKFHSSIRSPAPISPANIAPSLPPFSPNLDQHRLRTRSKGESPPTRVALAEFLKVAVGQVEFLEVDSIENFGLVLNRSLDCGISKVDKLLQEDNACLLSVIIAPGIAGGD
jgi:hypothetical protein